LNLDLESSVLIGDNVSDIQAGVSAGVGCNLLFAQTESAELLNTNYQRISTLGDALSFLTSGQCKW
jgi:D-glycero-D-manno-heptose 1,7-bisphosphate phosphatase